MILSTAQNREAEQEQVLPVEDVPLVFPITRGPSPGGVSPLGSCVATRSPHPCPPRTGTSHGDRRTPVCPPHRCPPPRPPPRVVSGVKHRQLGIHHTHGSVKGREQSWMRQDAILPQGLLAEGTGVTCLFRHGLGGCVGSRARPLGGHGHSGGHGRQGRPGGEQVQALKLRRACWRG